ncbi:MAG TPA: energy transducer TonB [Bacteroidota bacterium]|nr:energy transducer TonB [Bacteroidota bacterium]
MKQILVILVLVALYYFGCSTSEQTVTNSSPQILFQEPLPEMPPTINKLPRKLDIDVLVDENGLVKDVRLSSGNAEWDTSAIASIHQWKFSPARIDEKPIKQWMRMRASIQYVNPLYMSIAKISCNTAQDADSVYAALKHGNDLHELTMPYSIDTVNQDDSSLGEVNIYCFPKRVQENIEHLDTNEFTTPIAYGHQFVIFRRLK